MKKLGLLLLVACLVHTVFPVKKYNKFNNKSVQAEIAKIKQHVKEVQAEVNKYIIACPENKNALAQLKKLQKSSDILKTAELRRLEKEINMVEREKCLLVRRDVEVAALLRAVSKLEKKILILTRPEREKKFKLQKDFLALQMQLPVREVDVSLGQRAQIQLLISQMVELQKSIENKTDISRSDVENARKVLSEKERARSQAHDVRELDKKYRKLVESRAVLLTQLGIADLDVCINKLRDEIAQRARVVLKTAQEIIDELMSLLPKSKECPSIHSTSLITLARFDELPTTPIHA